MMVSTSGRAGGSGRRRAIGRGVLVIGSALTISLAGVTVSGAGAAPREVANQGANVAATSCPTTTGPASPVFTAPRTVMVDGLTRNFTVSTPNPAPAIGAAVPVIFALHGTGGDGPGYETSTHTAQTAVARGYAVIEPDAVTQSTSTTAWTVPSQGATPDDFKFFDEIIANISDVVCTNTDRIYAEGHSSGGAMSAFAACRWHSVAAVASFSGVNLINPARCSTRRVPLLITHGTADTAVPYNGAGYLPDPKLPEKASYTGSVDTDVDYWAKTTNGCTASTDAAPIPNAGATETLIKRTYTGCVADVVLDKVTGGQHVVFKTPADPVDSVAESLDFFDAHNRIEGPSYKPPAPPSINFPIPLPSDPPTLTLTPAGPFSDGDTVKVDLTGFSPSSSVAVAECKRGKQVTGPGSCALGVNGVLVYPGTDGKATATLKLAVGTINAAGDSCGPVDPCVIIAVNIGRACETNAVPITFTGGATQLPLDPVYPGCPKLLLSQDKANPGDVITVTGSAFAANASVNLGAYHQWPAAGAPSGASVVVTTSATGTFTTPFTAPTMATGIGAFATADPASQMYAVAIFRSPPNIGVDARVATSLTMNRSASVIQVGALAQLSGRLRTAKGAPMGRARVAIQSRKAGSASWKSLTTSVTNTAGIFAARIRPITNTDYRAVFTGSSTTLASTSATGRVLVRSIVSFNLTSSHLRLGQRVLFWGRVAPHVGGTAYLEFRFEGFWSVWHVVRVRRDGTYSFRWRSDNRINLPFRVVVPSSQTNASGVSGTARLVVD